MKKYRKLKFVPEKFEGECYIEKFKRTVWFKPGKILHREDGPAVFNHESNIKEWWFDGKRHRLNGPAVINPNGWQKEEFWIDGVRIYVAKYWRHPLVFHQKITDIINL